MGATNQQIKSKKISITIISVIVIMAFIYFVGYAIGQAIAHITQ